MSSVVEYLKNNELSLNNIEKEEKHRRNKHDKIKACYWDAMEEKDNCYIMLRNIIKNSFDYENPSKEQVKSLYDFIPVEILGFSIIYGGFDNYRVFEKLNLFIEEEYALIFGLMIEEDSEKVI